MSPTQIGFGTRSTIANDPPHFINGNSAALLSMTVLKAGGSSVDAVETAIKSLEDNQITNAGYGSNLCSSGSVECDASIVDQVGRSGAVGAVSNVQNPISAARSVLEASVRPLALGRVPPNFLVGKGAAEWAFEKGLMILPEEGLVAKAAKDRWTRWKRELDSLEGRRSGSGGGGGGHDDDEKSNAMANSNCATALLNGSRSSITAGTQMVSRSRRNTEDLQFLTDGNMAHSARGDLDLSESDGITLSDMPASSPRRNLTVDNLDALDAETGQGAVDTSMTWPQTLDGSDLHQPPLDCQLDTSNDDDDDNITDTVGAVAIDMYGNIAAGSSSGGIAMKHAGRVGPAALAGIGTCVIPSDPNNGDDTSVAVVTSGTGEHMATTMIARVCAERMYMGVKRVTEKERRAQEDQKIKRALKKKHGHKMKKSCKSKKGHHRPSPSLPSSSSSSSSSSDSEDELQQPRTFGPWTFQPASEDEALQSAIRQDFLAHPGVRNSHCQAAIGIMAVKMTSDGISFCFGHNTDSFALASMVDDDRVPMCLMSRKKRGDGGDKIAQGGRVTKGVVKGKQ